MLALSSAARKLASGLGSECAGAAKPVAAAKVASTTSVRMASSSYRLMPLSRPHDRTGSAPDPTNEAVEAPIPTATQADSLTLPSSRMLRELRSPPCHRQQRAPPEHVSSRRPQRTTMPGDRGCADRSQLR